MSFDPRTPVDDETWRNRFVILNLVRIGGTVATLFGLAIWETDFLRPGGVIALGLPLAIFGLLVSFGGSRWLIRKWRTPPES